MNIVCIYLSVCVIGWNVALDPEYLQHLVPEVLGVWGEGEV